jgi:hypothetical protein
MNAMLDYNPARNSDERRSLWRDNRIWWVNCLAVERFWFYAGRDLEVARGRRDAMLASLLQEP